jgi:glycosyltransferase involved in cell wall biosynthesis
MSAMILALTNLLGVPGGIPAFNRMLCRAARERAEALGAPLRVIAMMDEVGQRDEGLLGPASYVACGGDKRRFALEVARAVLRERGARLCLGHVNLAPLGMVTALGRGFGVIAHGTEVWTPLPWQRRLALRRARAIGCVSEHTAGCVQRVQGVAAGRCVRIINALDPERFAGVIAAGPTEGDGEASGGEAGGALRLLSVTRLHPQEPKGIDLVLRALPGLPGARYTVAGEGEALPRLKELAASLGVSDRVEFLGRVSDERRAEELRRCDVFVLPSQGEGFGIVYLEAMIYGKACVAARVGGAPEVVLDGETGRCVAPQVEPLREALAQLGADRALRRRLGRAGRERVMGHFLYPHFRMHAERFFDQL